MRNDHPALSYPLLSVGILLAAGIATGYFLHGRLTTFLVLSCTVCQLSLALICRKDRVQSWLILTTVFCLGFTLMSHQQDKDLQPARVFVHEELSSLDRTRLKTVEWRSALEESYRQMGIQQDGYALLVAMTLGDKRALSQELRSDFSISGVSHITAVSGLHIGIILQLLLFLLSGRGLYQHLFPWHIIVIAITSIWAYAFLIGLPASAVRSCGMFSIYCLATVMRRKSRSVNCLLLSAIAMLCLSPSYLFDIGFQLSFLSVLSILTVYPWMARRIELSPLGKYPLLQGVSMPIAVSIAAQLGTMPLVAYYFGYVSCYSLLANMIAIPSAILILYGGFAYLACTPLPWLQGMIGYLLGGVTEVLNGSVAFIAHLPGACIEGVKINILQLSLLYTALVAGCLLIHRLPLFLPSRSRLSDSHKGCSSRGCQTSPEGRCPENGRHTPSS